MFDLKANYLVNQAVKEEEDKDVAKNSPEKYEVRSTRVVDLWII